MSRGRFSKDIFPGARFGKLTVVERIPRTDAERSKIRCICDCGKETTPNADNLIKTKSCGCEKYGKGGQPSKVKIGEKYGKLTIVDLPKGKGIICKCDCGRDYYIPDSIKLRNGDVKSCGCYIKELTGQRNKDNARWSSITSDYRSKLTYKTWRSMVTRLYDSYRYRKVTACERLVSSPWGLVETIGHRPEEEMTIDRYPIWNGNYTCGDCDECKEKGWNLNIRWATRKQQSENRGSFNVVWTAFGKTLLKSQWVRLSGINEKTLYKRIQMRGWNVERALSTPDKFGNCYKYEGNL